MKTAFAATGILVLSSVSAFAHTPTHSQIEARQQRQLGEIEQGRQTGAITWREGLALRAEQKRIHALEESYERDGRLSPAERRNLTNLQNEARRDIVHEQNDGWHRAWWLPRFGR
jgi:hypothetical protein